MVNNKVLYGIIVALIIVGGLVYFMGNKNIPNEVENGQPLATQPTVSDQTMVDCSKAQDPGCFINRMNGCLPVTTKMTGSDKTAIDITVLGVENEKCHFQRKIDNVLNLDCYFAKGTLNMDTLDQTFGNDKGLQKVVDEACKQAGW